MQRELEMAVAPVYELDPCAETYISIDASVWDMKGQKHYFMHLPLCLMHEIEDFEEFVEDLNSALSSYARN
jgi:hypothetical protein